MMRRQQEWDRQLESVDQKQAELLAVQWRLVREQNGALARELAAVQQHLKELQVDSRNAVHEAQHHFRECESSIVEERSIRTATCEGFEQRMRRLRQDIDLEAKQRAAADAEIAPRIDALAVEVSGKTQESATLALELKKLREAYAHSACELASLRDALGRESSERRAADESTIGLVHELREMILKESRERVAANSEMLQTVRSAIDQDKSEREMTHSTIKSHIAVFQQDYMPHKEEVPALRSRLSDVETLVSSRVLDLEQRLESMLAEHCSDSTRLDRRLADLSVSVEKECAARAALAEETDQVLRTHRTKLRNLVSEQAEASRLSQERLQSAVMEHLEKESRTRQAHNEVLHGQITTHRTQMETKLESIEMSMQEIEERHVNHRGVEVRDWEAANLKLTEDLARQIRDLRDALQARLDEEVAARQSQASLHEEQLSFLDGFLHDVRALFLQKGSWTQRHLEKTRIVTAAITTTTTTSGASSAQDSAFSPSSGGA